MKKNWLDAAAVTIGCNPEDLDNLCASIEAHGKVTSTHAQQLTAMGIPVHKCIADAAGITRKDAGEAVRAGKITPDQLDAIFEFTTQEGGMFHQAKPEPQDPQ